MITFRYHVVSIVSVLLALAVGIAVGGGPLRGEVDDSLVTQVETDRQTIDSLEAQLTGAETGASFNDAAATALAPRLVGDSLEGRGVAVVALPGADPATISGLGAQIRTAGGDVSGSYRIAPALLDEEQQDLVEDLAARLATEVPDLAADSDASGYTRAGLLIARAIATTGEEPEDVDQSANAVLAGLSTAGLLAAEGTPDRRGDLILLVAGPEPVSELPAGAGAALTVLAGALADGARGVVLAGPTRAARADGLLAAARGDLRMAARVSTVDSAHLVVGQLVTVLTLAAAGTGEIGHYGAVDATDGAVPGA